MGDKGVYRAHTGLNPQAGGGFEGDFKGGLSSGAGMSRTILASHAVHLSHALASWLFAGVVLLSVLPADRAEALAVMPMGDSITVGFHDAGQGSYRYVIAQARPDIDMVGQYYSSSSFSFDAQHQGVGGYKIEQMLASYGPAIAQYQPDVVLLLAGTNNHWDGPDADYVNKYQSLLTLIRDNAPDARIILATVPKFGYDRVPATAYWTQAWVDLRNNETFPAMNAALVQLASTTPNVDLVDYYSQFDPATDLVADAVHPNVAGQTKLAELFMQELFRKPADLDRDGDIDDADFGIAFSNFTGPGGTNKLSIQGNLDADGDVDDADFGLAFAAFTGPSSASQVPEPASLIVLSLILTVLTRRDHYRAAFA